MIFRVNSLKTKLLWFYLLLIAIVVVIKIVSLHTFQLPQLYKLEAISDEKDIQRIKIAFQSKTKELGVLSYDNSVWDDTYAFVDDKNADFIESNFVHDTFASLGINGVHIYDKHQQTVWHEAWDLKKWTAINFSPMDTPSIFVQNKLLISEEDILKNKGKPTTRAGFTQLDDKIVLFASSSIFQSDLTGPSKGNLVFWRFWDGEVLADLQERAGIKFAIEMVKNTSSSKKADHGESNNLSSLGSSVKESYRTADNKVFDVIPFTTNKGGIKFTYTAPSRTFSTSWLSQLTIISLAALLFALFVLLLFFHYLIIRPIFKADKAVNTIIKENNHSIRFSSNRKDELGSLFNLIDRLLESVESTTQELKTHNVRLQTISKTDSLTKVPNRRAFDDHMKKLLDVCPSNTDISILVCDVDFFKEYNDFYGHAKGDNALKLVAQALRKNIHEDTDFIARYGGEEFVVVLKNTNSDNAMSVANNLIQAINHLNISHKSSDISNNVTISIGFHSFVVNGQKEYGHVFELADKALYQAKGNGRNRAEESQPP